MKEIMIKNAEGLQLNVNVVRFFRLNGMEYLIFSLNEVDEGGYAKLYVSKIVDNTGKSIEDDVEWNLIKDAIKNIVRSNKDNLPLPITDLSVQKIINLQIADQKIFKLNDSLLQLLMANVKEEVTIEPVTEVGEFAGVNPIAFEPANDFAGIQQETPVETVPQNIAVPSDNTEPTVFGYELDYKTLYENELKKNEELISEVSKYKEQINNIKLIIEG